MAVSVPKCNFRDEGLVIGFTEGDTAANTLSYAIRPRGNREGVCTKSIPVNDAAVVMPANGLFRT